MSEKRGVHTHSTPKYKYTTKKQFKKIGIKLMNNLITCKRVNGKFILKNYKKQSPTCTPVDLYVSFYDINITSDFRDWHYYSVKFNTNCLISYYFILICNMCGLNLKWQWYENYNVIISFLYLILCVVSFIRKIVRKEEHSRALWWYRVVAEIQILMLWHTHSQIWEMGLPVLSMEKQFKHQI